MHDVFSQSFDSCPKPKMQIDGLVLSARKGRFVEKIASSIRLTGGAVQKTKRQAVGHAGVPPCPGWRPRESIRLRSNAALGNGKVWAGITRWHCYTVFQVLFLPVRVNVQSWQDRQRWSSLWLFWYKARTT